MNHNITLKEPHFGKPLKECGQLELSEIVEGLFGLLDDIDTASDIYKPQDEESYKRFYQYAMKKAEDRGKYLTSDGYNLFTL